MSNITQILNLISNSLLLPVIVLLLIAVVYALIALGGFCASSIMLLIEQRKNRTFLRQIHRGELDVVNQEDCSLARHVAYFIEKEWNEIECEKYISEHLERYDRELERHRFFIKIGPMLGLMGTLIPMGPALAGLASGDIGSMAYNMQIAFATTVLGCFIAGVSVLIISVKKHHYTAEISNLRYLLDRQLEGGAHA